MEHIANQQAIRQVFDAAKGGDGEEQIILKVALSFPLPSLDASQSHIPIASKLSILVF